jgi:hypothetical protein
LYDITPGNGFLSCFDRFPTRNWSFLFLGFRPGFLRGFLLRRSRPVVEVVGDVMAIIAFREFCHQRRGMRDAVAALAFGDHLVFSGMAEYAGEALVLGLARAQEGKGLLVACRTVLVGDIRTVGNDFRLVGLVAFLAIHLDHFGGVGFMALHALRYYPVHSMAGRAEEIRVLAPVFLELRDLLVVAGEAGVGDFIAERDIQGLMWVFVAIQATFQFKMGFPRMALTAFGDVVLRCRAVAGVAVEAGDRLVFRAGGGYVRRRSRMTLDAVVDCQNRFPRRLGFRPAGKSQEERDRQDNG